MDNASKIIERIREEEIKPTPKWFFWLKNSLIWISFLLAVIMGALAFSVILLAIQQTDFSIGSHIYHSKIEMLLGILPFIWLIFVIVFLGVAITSIRNSRRGYKFSAFKMVSISILLSVAIGTLFFLGGGSDQLEKAFELNVLSYKSIDERKAMVWSQPTAGYLAGKIIRNGDSNFVLEDFDKNEWNIEYEGAFIARIVLLEPGETVKILGKMTGQHEFRAEEIRPWGGKRQRLRSE